EEEKRKSFHDEAKAGLDIKSPAHLRAATEVDVRLVGGTRTHLSRQRLRLDPVRAVQGEYRHWRTDPLGRTRGHAELRLRREIQLRKLWVGGGNARRLALDGCRESRVAGCDAAAWCLRRV